MASGEAGELGQRVHLRDGRHIDADVVIGADGLWSFVNADVRFIKILAEALYSCTQFCPRGRATASIHST